MRLFILSALLLSFGVRINAQGYQVGPGDVLKIEVLDVEGWANNYRIDVAGNLQLPLLGEIMVKDKTLLQVRNLISEGLKKGGFVVQPQVLIDMVDMVYKPIRVIGAVKSTGRLDLMSANLFLLDVLSEVGGLVDNAADMIIVMRAGVTIQISYSDLIFEGKKNIPILPGDTVAVPFAEPLLVSVLGEVNRQGQLEFNTTYETTILRVISAAGGFSDYAKRSRVSIRRRVDGKVENITVDVRKIQEEGAQDIAILNDDVIIVP